LNGKDPRPDFDVLEPILVTCISLAGSVLSKRDVLAYIETALQQDDVFQSKFLRNVIFSPLNKNSSLALGEGVEALLRSYGTERIDIMGTDGSSTRPVPPGPYVAYDKTLWQPWRLYKDEQLAFMVSLEPPRETSKKQVYGTNGKHNR
jgi:hypothetical protein